MLLSVRGCFFARPTEFTLSGSAIISSTWRFLGIPAIATSWHQLLLFFLIPVLYLILTLAKRVYTGKRCPSRPNTSPVRTMHSTFLLTPHHIRCWALVRVADTFKTEDFNHHRSDPPSSWLSNIYYPSLFSPVPSVLSKIYRASYIEASLGTPVRTPVNIRDEMSPQSNRRG